jgi:ADP-heptose:LPS heptosyltransferase
VIRLSSLGDVILSSVVLDPLYEKGCNVDFLTFKPFSDVFEKDYRIKNLIAVDKSRLKSISDIYSFTKSLDKYDYVLDLHSNLRSFLIGFFLKLRYNPKILRYKKQSLKRRLKILDPNFNVLKAYLEPLKKLGIENLNYRPKVIITNQEVEKVKTFLPQKFISLGTGARYKSKVYPYYKELSEILLENGFNVVLVGSKEDLEMDKSIYPKEVLDLRGKITLRETIAVISQGLATISNDSAIAHMSRAVGIKVLMIYGSTHPYFGFAPLKDEGDYIFKNLPCQPCSLHGQNSCKYKTFECLTSISPQEVYDKLKNLI